MKTIIATDKGNIFIGKLNDNFEEASAGGSGAADAVSVKSCGAIGDGLTDDTEAIEDAFDAAYSSSKKVFFDPGTYLIRRSLPLKTGIEVYGYRATIKKQVAVTTTLSSATTDGQTYIDVTSASGFKVGDQFFITGEVSSTTANNCTYGIVTSIDGNRIYFTSCHDTVKTGCVKAHDAGCQVSTSFAILRSWAPLDACDGAYIHDLTLDGNKAIGEAAEWSNSCIHIDTDTGTSYSRNGITFNTIQRNVIIKNVIIKNSPRDGISDQGRGGGLIEGCRIENSLWHGIHFGTKYNNAKVALCTIRDCGAAGVFWCEDVNGIIVADNYIDSCNKGVSDQEFATPAKHSIVVGNIFKNITSVVFDFKRAESTSASGYGHLIIANNIVEDLKGIVANLVKLNYISFTGNVICEIVTAPSYLIRADNINVAVIANNISPTNTAYVDKDNVTNLIEVNNSWNG